MPFCGHLTTLYVFNTRICKLNKKYVVDSYAPGKLQIFYLIMQINEDMRLEIVPYHEKLLYNLLPHL